MTGPLYKLFYRPIKRLNILSKGDKKDNYYVNNRYARIVTIIFTNIFINPIYINKPVLDNGTNGQLTGIVLADLGLCNRFSKGFGKPALFS